MKKSFCTVMSATIAMVAGAVLADTDPYQYSDWFKGIGNNPTSISSLGETGGTWSGLTGAGVSFADGKIVLDDQDDTIKFTVSATEPDTEVMDRLQVTMSGIAGPLAHLPTSSELSAAQVVFAIADNSGTLGYYVWIGGDSWQLLSGATPVDGAEIVITVDVDYSVANEPRARFSVGDTVLTLSGNEWTAITASAAQSVRKISTVGIGGSGAIAKVDGSVRLGIASVGGIKYGSIADAVNAAASGSTKKVEVLRPTSENVDLTGKGDVVIADNGNTSGTITVPADQEIKLAPAVGEFTIPASSITGASGTYELSATVSGGTVSAASITLPSELTPYKEVASATKEGNKVNVTIRTKDSNVAAVSVGGRTLPVTAGLRTFLSKKVAAYSAPDSSTANLQTALEANGSNNLPVWQSYVLGLDPETATSVPKFQPVGADDSSTSSLLVKVPAVNPPSDSGYTVKFRLSDNGTKVADYDNPQSIPLPLDGAAHAYTIKPVIISQ